MHRIVIEFDEAGLQKLRGRGAYAFVQGMAQMLYQAQQKAGLFECARPEEIAIGSAMAMAGCLAKMENGPEVLSELSKVLP